MKIFPGPGVLRARHEQTGAGGSWCTLSIASYINVSKMHISEIVAG